MPLSGVLRHRELTQGMFFTNKGCKKCIGKVIKRRDFRARKTENPRKVISKSNN